MENEKGIGTKGVKALQRTVDRHPAALWAAALLATLAAHWIWLRLSDVPPPWDMAYHQLKGWDFLEAFRQGEPWSGMARLSPNYPPLYYLVEACLLSVSRDPDRLVFWSNLPGLLLLSWATWRMAARALAPRQAVWAGLLPLLFPFSAWVAREALLDGLLAGLASAAGYLILGSDWFRDRGRTLLFGLVCAAGVLTKWTFPLYLAGPVIFAILVSRDRRRSLIHLAWAALLAIPLVLPYYWPNLSELAARYPTTDQAGLIPWKPYPRHGEPGLDNFYGWIYYPRVFFSYYLGAPLAAAWLWGAVGRLGLPGRQTRESPAATPGVAPFLWCWLLSGIFLLTLLTPKDPRFALPLAAPLATLLFLGWRQRPRGGDWVLAIACLQFLLVSFPTPLGQFKLALAERPGDRDYQNLQREWVLFSTRYFDVTGPPTRENWALDGLLTSLPDGTRVGFLPDLVRFHPGALQLEARRKGREVAVFKIGDSADWPQLLQRADYVVAKTGLQGITFITGFNSEVEARLQSEGWPAVDRLPLPDGSEAVLYRSPRVGAPVGGQGRFAPASGDPFAPAPNPIVRAQVAFRGRDRLESEFVFGPTPGFGVGGRKSR